MVRVIVLLDWNNYKGAKLEPVKKQFLASDDVNKAKDLVDTFLAQQLSKTMLTTQLRHLLQAHTKDYRKTILEDLAHPERLLQDRNLAPEDHVFPQLQHSCTHLIVVTECTTHWKKRSPQLVMEKARLLADDYRGVTQEDFQALEQSAQAAAAAAAADAEVAEGAARQERSLQDWIRKVLRIEADIALGTARRQEILQTLEIPGATADEAIASVAHANAESENPTPLCIVSNDTDFRQLKSHDTYQVTVGLPKPAQFQVADVDQHFHKKQALCGKGRDDLNDFGTVFGLIPDGVECRDVIRTTVKGAHRPGDALYAEQFIEFTTAVRLEEEAVSERDIEGILEWLQKYNCQVPSICARFMMKMVNHSIDPYSKWSAMPLDVQLCCTREAERVLEAAMASAAAPRVPPMQPGPAMQLADVANWPSLGTSGQSSRSAGNTGTQAGSSRSARNMGTQAGSSGRAGNMGTGAGSSMSAGNTGTQASSSNHQTKPKGSRGNRRNRGNRGNRGRRW